MEKEYLNWEINLKLVDQLSLFQSLFMTSPEAYRNQTPGCLTTVHFNNAGSSLMPQPVIDEIIGYITLEASLGGYEAADQEAARIATFYSTFAELIGAKPENIAWTSSATNSFARALSSIPFRNDDVVIIANEDYISNQLAFLSLEKRFGIRLVRARTSHNGGVDVDELRQLIQKHSPRLISLSHVPSNTGLIQPVEEVGRLCEEHDILFLLDACQSVGQLPVNVANLKCDFLCATMRKFLRGPRGAGFLYVSDKALSQGLEPLFIDLRGASWKDLNQYEARPDAKRFEDGEVPYALMLASTRAARYAIEVGLDEIRRRNTSLGDKFRSLVSEIPSIRLLDEGAKLSSIITMKIEGSEPAVVLKRLREKNINTSIAYRNFALPDFDRKGADWALRVSPHYYNSEDEVYLIASELQNL